MGEMAMFPLGTVLLPGMVLPLHVFEPRYRTLARHVVHGSGNGEFGVTLIERGSEVGGGDERTDVGVVAKVVQAEEFDDGRWGLVTAGTDRIRVDTWLEDHPYPHAHVTRWPDVPDEMPTADAVAQLTATMREILDLARRLGHDVSSATLDLDDDPVVATWQLIARSPLGPSDRQKLLCCPGPGSRVALAHELLVDQRDLLHSLAEQGPGDG